MMSLVANAPVIRQPDLHTEAARFLSGRLPFRSVFVDSPFSLDDFADIAPELLNCSLLLFVGAAMWSYGTRVAIRVVNTSVTSWGALLIAAAFHTAAWLATPADWVAPYLIGGSRIALCIALSVSTWLVDQELHEFERLKAIITKPPNADDHRIRDLPERFVKKVRRGSKTASASRGGGVVAATPNPLALSEEASGALQIRAMAGSNPLQSNAGNASGRPVAL